MNELTLVQSRVLEHIRQTIDSAGIPPTRAEIAAAMGYASPNAVQEHLVALEKKGALILVKGISRGIRIPHEGAQLR